MSPQSTAMNMQVTIRMLAAHSPEYSVPLTAAVTYSHALLILLKSSKSKHQVVHEQKFKDLLSSTCQVSVERIVWGSIPIGSNILPLDFFHIGKPLMPILPLLPILSICEKLDCSVNMTFSFVTFSGIKVINFPS